MRVEVVLVEWGGSYTEEEFSDFFITEVINGNKTQQIISEER